MVIIINRKLLIIDFDPANKDKSIIMNYLVHASDISNPFKP